MRLEPEFERERHIASALGRAALAALCLALALPAGGCYTKRMQRIEGALDTLRAQVDSTNRGETTAWRQLRRDLAEQRETLLSLKAGTNVASEELVHRIEQLSSQLDDLVDRVTRVAGSPRMTPPAGTPADSARANPGAGVDADALYEQAAKDFTQGRFELSLSEFRQLLNTFPEDELADNALYGVGESFYALARYDSAGTAYSQVEERYPRGDRVPAALYKLGMVHQKLGQKAEARKVFTRLREKYPRSGEARLAEERLREVGR